MNKSESEILKDLTDSVDDMRARGANVCLSCFDNCLSAHLPVLYEYEVHPCAVCYYLKRNRLTAGKCPRNKERLKAKLPDFPYAASCWAGVEEWVFPVTSEGRTVMCIHLTGYRGGTRATEKSDKLRLLCGEEFGKAYREKNRYTAYLYRGSVCRKMHRFGIGLRTNGHRVQRGVTRNVRPLFGRSYDGRNRRIGRVFRFSPSSSIQSARNVGYTRACRYTSSPSRRNAENDARHDYRNSGTVRLLRP